MPTAMFFIVFGDSTQARQSGLETLREVMGPGFKIRGRGSCKFNKRRRVAQDLGFRSMGLSIGLSLLFWLFST